MKTTRVLTIAWFVLLIGLAIFGFYRTSSPKEFTVQTDLHQPYIWYGDSSKIIGDGETVIHLSSTSQFTIYDSEGLYVTSGFPGELLPGESTGPYVADFQTKLGERYSLGGGTVKIWTDYPANISFESFEYGYGQLAWASLFFLFFSCWIALEAYLNQNKHLL